MPEIGIAVTQSFDSKSIIDYFRLKKDFSSKKLELFRNESIELVIGREGSAGGAAAAAFLINRFDNIEKINFIHVGECKAKNPGLKPGTLVLCNKITDYETDKSYYPDILFKHALSEISLITIPAIKKGRQIVFPGFDCIDAEASGFMDASLTFLPPHMVFCMKIIAGLDGGKKHRAWTDKNLTAFKDFTDLIRLNMKRGESILTGEDHLLLNSLSASLRFTEAMKSRLYKAAGDYKTAGGNLEKTITGYFQFKINHKNESRKIFEKIIKELSYGSF